MSLTLTPISLKAANAWVAEFHRHSNPTRGHKFSIGVSKGDELVGVAIVGRPVGRGADDGRTLEVLRVCTDGTYNACSFLYGASRRAIKALGYKRAITYTRADEDGASLRASGWVEDGTVAARSWNTPSRPREDQDERVPRIRWRVDL